MTAIDYDKSAWAIHGEVVRMMADELYTAALGIDNIMYHVDSSLPLSDEQNGGLRNMISELCRVMDKIQLESDAQVGARLGARPNIRVIRSNANPA